MKRKALLILVLLSFACFGVANAQTLFSEDFEDGSMPSGWTTSGNGSWSVATAVNSSHPSNAGHGTYCAQIKHGTTGNATKLITPEIDLSTVTSAELSFMHVEQSWGGDIDGLKVYYRTSPSGTWTQIVEYTAAYASWATEDGIVLPNLSSTYQLAFEYIDNYGYGLGIDYVNIIQGASCPKPASLTAVANGQSAILNWTSDATSFDIAWSLNPNADPDQYIETTGHNATTFTRNDLTIDADYYFWVRANCGADGISTWAGPVSVHIGYCTPAPSSVDNNGISHVTFGTGSYVVDNETPTATYADYHDLIGEVEAGIEASVAITYKTSYTYNTYIWVDLDNDLSFERSEIICQGESTNSNPTTLTLTFTIPATQTPGNYRMRIGGADSGMSSADNANPCYTGTYACFQDYTLRVVEGAPLNFITNITGTEDWNEFCRGVNNGLDYSDKTVTLANDISVTTMVGTENHAFNGTFDGQGNTLTVTIQNNNEQGVAPFHYISNATIQNLIVTGSVTQTGSNPHASGLVGFTIDGGTNTIQNCLVHTNVTNSASSGNRHIGGIIGHAKAADNTIIGCVYDGTLSSSGDNGYKGGLVGWSNESALTLTDCFFVGHNSDGGKFHPIGCKSSPTVSGTVTNCYYTVNHTINDDDSHSIVNSTTGKGVMVYSITGDNGITVAMDGTAANTYTYSGLSLYSPGITYTNDGTTTFYAASGDQVSLTLDGSSDGYSAIPGTLTGDSNPYTLEMGAGNTLIMAGTIDYITEINSSEDWITFCQAINDLGHDYSGDTVTLMNDIVISMVAGSDDTPFRGTFDGGGNTITLDFGSTSDYLDQRCAPFYRIGNATIKNLVTDGNIYSSQQNNAGLVCRMETGTTNYITNCISNVSIHTNRSGDGTNGGFVAFINSNNCTVNFEGCAFVGELIGSSTTNWGGFVGWRDYKDDNKNYANFTNCLFAPRTVSISTSSGSNSRTFCRSRENTTNGATYTNCYYTATVQANDGGKQAYTITGDEGITVAMADTANNTYGVSGLSFYSPGFTFTNDDATVLYASNGDNVSLNLSGSSTGYSAVPGELTGDDNPYTLAMGNSNTIITTHINYITEINNIDDWNTFCLAVNSGHDYSGETVYLMENITDSITFGTSSAFKGTFDGQGHTITVNFTSTDARCAPFNTVTGTSQQNPVTIKNLKVTGIIRTSHIQTAGFIGYVNSYCTITNCISDVTIVSSFDGHGCRAAGFIGQTDSQAHVTFTGCAFTGKLLGASASGCAGFVGFNYSHYSAWAQSGSATVSFTDCIFAPAEVTMGVGSGNAMNVKSATFARSFGSGSSVTDSSEGLTFNNCYYTQSFGTVQGKQAYSITSFETNLNPVTVELYGEHTYYDVSDIDGYAIGIIYNGTIYAGNGENVSLNLEGSPSGAYDATYGTITGTENPFTLAMEAHDTEISALTCPAPTNLTATTTSSSAVLNWNGISDHYNLQLHEAHFFESFEEDLSQWTIYHEGDSVSWEWGIENPHDNSADLNAHSGNYAAVSYSDFDIHADNWLVSPQILFPNQSTLKFWIMRSTYDDALDEYEVRLSTTGNAIEDFDVILKEKTAANSEWTEVSIDLSAYDGQQGYIAIRHDYTGGFFIMVDDFGIYGWSEPISVTGNTYTVENLLPNTYYRWQVQADCGDEDGVSFWTENNFTTLIACPVPFDLTVSETTANGATIAWTGYSESYNVWVGQLEMAAINYDFEDNTISTDFTNSTSYPWTVTSNDTHAGTYSVKSGGAGIASATSDLNLEVTVEHDATLSFWARISSEASYDKGYFSIDGVNQSNLNGISGNGAWINYTYTLEAGSHTLRWYYSKDSSVNSNNDCFYVDDITIESSTILSEMNYTTTESPLLLNDASNILPETTYLVKVKGICDSEETDYSEGITFTTLGENTKIFVIEGDWSDGDNWVPVGVPSIDDDVILRAEATVFDIAEANIIAIDESGALIIEDGGQLKTNADVEATMKKFIIGYGSDYVETNNGYYLMTLPIATPIAAADAGLITEESDYDLYGWDRTATDEEWQNNHDGIDLQNGIGYLYANRDDMEMSFTATLRNSGEPVVVTPAYDEVEHGGWNLFGNPFPCEAYITTEAEGMTFYRLVSNELVPIEGAIAPLEAFFVKATSAGQTFTISREAPAGR